MESTHLKEVKDLKGVTRGHVLYFFENQDKYITRIVDFIISGVERNEYSIIVENDRIIPLINKRLSEQLDEKALVKVKFVNNYDFYYAQGDFSINSIFDFLPDVFEDDSDSEIVIRSWAHVEWRDEHEISNKLMGSEQEADLIVSETKLLSVCAYDSGRVSSELKEGLLNCHNLLIID